ncbi:hypothetical protein [Actinomadura sp. CNU-125]|uniref:hypothetical protein n=1 Tax=Actinomadura sp. CNU-125 TaxID=1904961 RepID=UPI0021CCA056|nr:hypothetical protein [Actinomadura sp. CNU-125]
MNSRTAAGSIGADEKSTVGASFPNWDRMSRVSCSASARSCAVVSGVVPSPLVPSVPSVPLLLSVPSVLSEPPSSLFFGCASGCASESPVSGGGGAGVSPRTVPWSSRTGGRGVSEAPSLNGPGGGAGR